MSVALAPRTGLIGTPEHNGLKLPDDLTFEEWSGLLSTVDFLVEASPWMLVDVVTYGEDHFGEQHSQAFPTAEEDPHGASQSRMKQAGWMGRVYPRGTRVPEASYTHHRIAADLPPIDRARELKAVADAAATDKPISTRELGRRVKARQEQLAGGAVTVDGEVVCSADLPLSPDDLADEARAALEIRLSEMGSRMRPGFSAGFVAALIWAGQDDAFKPGRTP